ncbi:MAG: cysteine peptidase family C39 domain-containing protein, partial [bacterium]
MQGNKITFFDSYWYCFSNSTAMLLSSVGEDISPRVLEVLSGVGLGATISQGGLPLFSGLTGEPDNGITKALEILGFEFEERASEKPGSPPFDELEKVLKDSPAIIGPLDMQYLVYNPGRPNFEGVDHFVLVYRIAGDKVFLHDPAGYAHVSIGKDDLEKAWRAESIVYRRG